MKRILSFILAVALIVTLLPALPAQAATSGTTGKCTWTLNGTITVNSGNSRLMAKGNCIIDKSTGKLIVGCKNTVIPTDGSVTTIGNSAFRQVTGLSSISIPASVTKIDEYAFANSGIKSVTLNSGLTSIGLRAFSVCDIQSIHLPDTLKTIGDNAFSGTGLRSVVVPDSVTDLGTNAFTNCSNLSSITIGAGISSIHPETFMGCPRQILKVSPNSPYYYSVDDSAIIEKSTDTLVLGNQYGAVPAQAKMIGYYAFTECNGLKSIKIPDNIEGTSKNSLSAKCPFFCSNLCL